MASIDWYYHRKNCATCTKSQEFLQSHSVGISQQVDAKKEVVSQAAFPGKFPTVQQICATRGKKVVRFTVDAAAGGLAAQAILDVVIGPSGNLRAPSVLKEETLLVGFDSELYTEILKLEKIP